MVPIGKKRRGDGKKIPECGKYGYVSRQKAEATLRAWQHRDGETYDGALNAYHCRRCGFWNLGNSDR